MPIDYRMGKCLIMSKDGKPEMKGNDSSKTARLVAGIENKLTNWRNTFSHVHDNHLLVYCGATYSFAKP